MGEGLEQGPVHNDTGCVPEDVEDILGQRSRRLTWNRTEQDLKDIIRSLFAIRISVE